MSEVERELIERRAEQVIARARAAEDSAKRNRAGLALIAAATTLAGGGHRRQIPDTLDEHVRDILELAERYAAWIEGSVGGRRRQ